LALVSIVKETSGPRKDDEKYKAVEGAEGEGGEDRRRSPRPREGIRRFRRVIRRRRAGDNDSNKDGEYKKRQENVLKVPEASEDSSEKEEEEVEESEQTESNEDGQEIEEEEEKDGDDDDGDGDDDDDDDDDQPALGLCFWSVNSVELGDGLLHLQCNDASTLRQKLSDENSWYECDSHAECVMKIALIVAGTVVFIVVVVKIVHCVILRRRWALRRPHALQDCTERVVFSGEDGNGS
jgi:hypothetical protein